MNSGIDPIVEYIYYWYLRGRFPFTCKIVVHLDMLSDTDSVLYNKLPVSGKKVITRKLTEFLKKYMIK